VAGQSVNFPQRRTIPFVRQKFERTIPLPIPQNASSSSFTTLPGNRAAYKPPENMLELGANPGNKRTRAVADDQVGK